ncbi:MAG: PIG-L family deacetylase, partial [Alphaproteobacteria bacterium]|nr:PIG-L family deacetylase [Alphaproteobacteria bacterium]
MEVDKLLIIAHPDDEVLWGGMNLILQSGWFVICSTHLNDPVRS